MPPANRADGLEYVERLFVEIPWDFDTSFPTAKALIACDCRGQDPSSYARKKEISLAAISSGGAVRLQSLARSYVFRKVR